MASDSTMFRTGVLVLTKPLHVIHTGIPAVLTKAAARVRNTLYVHLLPDDGTPLPQEVPNGGSIPGVVNPYVNIPSNPFVKHLVFQLYQTSATVCQTLDVRVLISNINCSVEGTPDFLTRYPYVFTNNCDVVLIDKLVPDSHSKSVILQELSKTFVLDENIHVVNLPWESEVESISNGISLESPEAVTSSAVMNQNGVDTSLEVYQHAVMGGTFDRLHVGHKILLTDACLRCSESVTVGITDGVMNNKKTLCELILPVDQRIEDVKTFMTEVKPRLKYKVVPIEDAFGPSTQDPQLQCIVVSQETLRGGHKVNEERARKGLSQLDVHVIDLVEDSHHSPHEEVKISSSSTRKRLLGTLLKDVEPRPGIAAKPYRIGLAGGIASGKSSVCKRLQKLGAAIVDCDKLGHKVYLKGTECFQRIVSEFGSGVVGEDGEIRRRALGAIVFSDQSQMTKLNEIVWPEIAKLAEEEIHKYAAAGKSVVILDAAVLLEAGWDQMVHEVWSTIIPTAEAVKRLEDRNKLSEAEALKRIQSQMTSEERVQRSNVILSTLWEYDVTQQQVEKAWKLLNERITGEKSQL